MPGTLQEGGVAGTIETIGSEVKDFKEGDAVYGIIASGGYWGLIQQAGGPLAGRDF